MKQSGWKEIPAGGIIDKPGSALDYCTGEWRTFKPVVDEDKCTNCLMCWLYCPDSAVIIKDEQKTGIDYEHCKGCGICAEVCPANCIEMQEEQI